MNGGPLGLSQRTRLAALMAMGANGHARRASHTHGRTWASNYLAFRFRSAAIQSRAAATGSGLSRKWRRTIRPRLSTAVQLQGWCSQWPSWRGLGPLGKDAPDE
jgi:hypothetical protein